MALETGTVIDGRFEIERLVGSGGMGSVYRARDLTSASPVALKVMLEAERGDTGRFRREAEALARITHPAVVRYVAHGETERGAPWLAMEWLEGLDLGELLRSTRVLPVPQALVVASRVASGLSAAHAAGLVHRDIKPANVFLPGGEVGAAKVLDFGVVRVGAAEQVRTRTGSFLGTPGYISPEQARGARQIGPSADVFSLGCVLYECLVGEPAFAGESVIATLARLLIEDAPRLRDARPDLPADLDALLASMLAKEPAQRPADGDAVVRAFEALEPIAESERSVTQRPAPANSLSPAEQQTITVVLARSASLSTQRSSEQTPDSAATLPAVDEDPQLESLRSRLGGRRVRIERLADGSVLFTFAPGAAATDRAAQAARASLVVRDALSDASVAVASGRAMGGARVPIGEAIDRAVALLERAAGDGLDARAVRLDALTAALLDARFAVRRDGAVPVLAGEATRDDGPRALLGVSTPCVGRERELGALAALLDDCVAEPMSRVALVTGAPGMGKSRLRQEFLRAARARDDGGSLRVWSARGDALRAGSPFALASDVLRDAAGMREGGPNAEQRAALEAFARPLLEGAGSGEGDADVALGLFAELCSVGEQGPAGAVPGRDPTRLTEQAHRAFEQLFMGACRSGPLLVVIEDMHWGDRPTAALLDHLLRRLHDQPFMVLALARPEVHEVFPKLWPERDLQTMPLAPLTRRACERLAQQVLHRGVPPERVKAVVERAQGNPFFLEELLRAVSEGRDALPESVLAMVQTRLEALDPHQRRVLRAASVYGTVFWAEALPTLLGAAAGSRPLRDVLAALDQSELIGRAPKPRFQDCAEYVFRHALVREAAYAMLTDADRALGHRLAGEWLEAAGEHDAKVLASHYERGNVWDRAATWLLRAARASLLASDADEVSALAARAEFAARKCGARDVLGDVLVLRCEAQNWFGTNERIVQLYDSGVGELAPDSDAWAQATYYAILALGRTGRFLRVKELGALVESLKERISPTVWHGLRGFVAMQAYIYGDLAFGDAVMATVNVAAVQYDRHELSMLATAALVGTMHGARLRGRIADEYRHALELRGVMTGFADRWNFLYGEVSEALVLFELGAIEDAMAMIDNVLLEANKRRNGRLQATALETRAVGWLMQGDAKKALADAEDGIAIFDSTGDVRRAMRAAYLAARALIELGEFDRAELFVGRIDKSVAYATTFSNLGWLARIKLALARGDREGAARCADAARADFALRGEAGESLHALRVAVAESWLAVGRDDEARVLLARARAELVSALAGLPDQTWVSRALTRVPANAKLMELAEKFCGPNDETNSGVA